MNILRKVGNLAAAAQAAYSASALTLSEKIAQLEDAYKEYNNAIMYRELPLFSSKNCSRCGEALYAVGKEEDAEVIVEFSLECSNPKCGYSFLVWKKEE